MTTSHKSWETLAPGECWCGFWQPGHDSVSLPILAARGEDSGPVLLVTGGVHGDEYEGPAAIHELFETLDVSALSGTVIGLPIANLAAWNARSRFTPEDSGDLNRAFPGRGENATGRLALTVFETFIRNCDALIDLHSGGVNLIHMPLVGWYEGGTKAEALARSFSGRLHPWLIPNVAGVLSYETHRLGKIALGLEWGGGGRLDPAGVAALSSGLRRAMIGLEMLTKTNEIERDDRPPIAGGYETVDKGGLFHASVTIGDCIEEGGLLGQLRDPLGDVVSEVRATRKGTVAGLAHIPKLRVGDRVAYIG